MITNAGLAHLRQTVTYVASDPVSLPELPYAPTLIRGDVLEVTAMKVDHVLFAFKHPELIRVTRPPFKATRVVPLTWRDRLALLREAVRRG